MVTNQNGTALPSIRQCTDSDQSESHTVRHSNMNTLVNSALQTNRFCKLTITQLTTTTNRKQTILQAIKPGVLFYSCLNMSLFLEEILLEMSSFRYMYMYGITTRTKPMRLEELERDRCRNITAA